MTQRVLSPAAIEYPSGDGEPMAENDWQLRAILDAFGVLDHYFRDRPDVYVSSDLLIYYEEGNPKARVAPDVFVAFGAPKHNRQVYKLWEEGPVPAFVMEVASRGTWREDDGPKAELYEWLGVKEYWQYDPTGDYLGLRLKGRRLVAGRYEPQPVVESLDGTVFLRSETLGLDFRVKGEERYFFDPAADRRLPDWFGLDAARQDAETRAEAAETQAEAAETRAEAAETQAEAAETQAEAAETRADAAETQAEAAETRAEAAETRADAAEARVAELEALLRGSHGP